MKTYRPEKARFDTRLTKEQKQFFEHAAAVGGDRSLSDFVISTVEERAQQIINDSENIISSQRDSEIFFDAIFNPGKPSNELILAVQKYNKLISE